MKILKDSWVSWHWSRWLRQYNFFLFWKFHLVWCDVGETPRIIEKMTNFWRLVFSSINWLLATLFDTLITIRENHWLLRIIWRFSEYVSEYESVFRICVWIIIHKRKWCLTFAYRPPYNHKRKWCLTFAYRLPYNNNKATFFMELNKSLSNIARKYENILIWDWNINFDNLKKGGYT